MSATLPGAMLWQWGLMQCLSLIPGVSRSGGDDCLGAIPRYRPHDCHTDELLPGDSGIDGSRWARGRDAVAPDWPLNWLATDDTGIIISLWWGMWRSRGRAAAFVSSNSFDNVRRLPLGAEYTTHHPTCSGCVGTSVISPCLFSDVPHVLLSRGVNLF